MSSIRENWQKGLPNELQIWEAWIAGESAGAEERALRLSSGRPFPWWAKPLIPGNPARLRVLDVGAGPVTALGPVWEDKLVTIVPVDPLATEYEQLLRDNNITPPVRTIYGVGETLSEQFQPDSFDFAYASNCLDQTIDPVGCHRQILTVLKPGCSLVSIHLANQGEEENYEGVYQWNFSINDGRLIIWNHSEQHDLFDECAGIARHTLEKDGQFIKMTLTRGA
jgi:hypothetical protein